VSGQQYEYAFDDIGNRTGVKQNGNEKRKGNYQVGEANEYGLRTVPGYADVMGSVRTNATLTLNLQPTERKERYFHGEVAFSNVTAAVYGSLTNLAVMNDGSNPATMVKRVVNGKFSRQPSIGAHCFCCDFWMRWATCLRSAMKSFN
ncbi:MAG: hypothetical protein K0Q55_3665, partial [Verrucomicrobia bacterium]|nr:hypothetical protein [Verrucomicrobiota bacterium]